MAPNLSASKGRLESALRPDRALAGQYVAAEQLAVLPAHCYGGNSAKNLTLAAHEVGHAEQHARLGWMAPALRRVLIGRLWLEWDASRRARVMMQQSGLVVREGALRDSWRGYFVPALWQVGLMIGLGLGPPLEAALTLPYPLSMCAEARSRARGEVCPPSR